VRAQQPAKIARIGHLDLGPASARANRVEALRAGLRDLGWVEGRNIIIVFRWAEGVEQLPELAAELVRMNVDLIFAPSSTIVEAARQATKTIPIIFCNHADPIGTGHVASLSRPGGNITGLSELSTEIDAKALEILKEALPHATRICFEGSSGLDMLTESLSQMAPTRLSLLSIAAVRKTYSCLMSAARTMRDSPNWTQ
jgi:putative ABC transport system substrate-binding protein